MHTEKEFNCDKYLSKLSDESLVIFLFHGVIKKPVHQVRNYNRKHILFDNFIDLITCLSNNGNPISMDEILSIKNGRSGYPPCSYAITFDDGFKNNYDIAAPILDEHSTPAIFYITTDFVDSNLMSWIDQIEYCFERVGEASFFLPWSKTQRHVNNAKSKIDCLKEIRTKVKSNPRKYLDNDLVEDIFDQCKVDLIKSNSNEIDQKMLWSDILGLSQNDLFTIGGHTHSHTSLAFLDDNELESEINISLRYLQEKANLTTPHYSYPEGTDVDYSEKVIESLRNHGIQCCPTAIEGSNDHETNLFHLKRATVI